MRKYSVIVKHNQNENGRDNRKCSCSYYWVCLPENWPAVIVLVVFSVIKFVIFGTARLSSIIVVAESTAIWLNVKTAKQFIFRVNVLATVHIL